MLVTNFNKAISHFSILAPINRSPSVSETLPGPHGVDLPGDYTGILDRFQRNGRKPTKTSEAMRNLGKRYECWDSVVVLWDEYRPRIENGISLASMKTLFTSMITTVCEFCFLFK